MHDTWWKQFGCSVTFTECCDFSWFYFRFFSVVVFCGFFSFFSLAFMLTWRTAVFVLFLVCSEVILIFLLDCFSF